jgi:pimeloyl-ACP methyl ester carboxylesterase
MIQTTLYKNDSTLSYAVYGDDRGYPILIQHGLIASIKDCSLFDRLIKLGTRLICIARPGYGQSSPYRMKNIAEWADIVSVLIEELGLSQFDILGMSSGAPYSYAIGHRFPDKARNLFIFSGTPALYDDKILAHWPYEVKRDASIAEMEKLAYELFFAQLSQQDLENDDIRDSMMNHCFGIAQDFKLRCVDWGFNLSDIRAKVWMRHSRSDTSVPLITAELTAGYLPNCTLEIRENEAHFSFELLDNFIKTTMASWYVK